MKKGALGLQASMAPLLAAFAGFAGVMKFFSLGTGFEDALADLSAITGSTGKDLEFLKEESLRLGKASKSSSEEVATAFKLVASAKSELLDFPDKLSSVTEEVLLLKNATGLDLDQAAISVTESLNLMGAGAEEANRFVNVLAAGSKIGASEVFETSEAIRKSGVAAKLAGVNFEELNSLIQVLAKNGQKGAIAGTGLNTSLLKMEKTGLREIMPSVVGVTTAFQNLKDMNLNAAEQMDLFGLEGIKVGGVLINNAELSAKWVKELTGTTIANDQANVRLATMSSRMRGLGVTIANAVIRTFERLTPVFETVIADMERFFNSISADDVKNFADALKPVLSTMINLAKAAAAVASNPIFKAVGGLVAASASGLADLGTLATGGSLSAENSASFQNAIRRDRSQAEVSLQVSAGPGASIDQVKSSKSANANLEIGINNEGAR